MIVGLVPRASSLYQGDIDEAVVKVQKASGVFIDKAWWDKNVGDQGTRGEILNRFDDAYAKYIDSIPDKEPSVTPEMIAALPPTPDYSKMQFSPEQLAELSRSEAQETAPPQSPEPPQGTLPPPA